MTGTRTARLTYDDFLALTRFPSLDGLRALAITVVVFQHSHELAVARASHGINGVLLFFVLSGFLITSLMIREEARYGRVQLRAFAIRRAFRILPLFYGVLLVYVVLIIGLRLDDRVSEFRHAIPYYVAFLQEHVKFASHPAGVPYLPFEVTWSLGFEEKFYLVWPVLAFGLLVGVLRRWRVPVALMLATLAVCAPLVSIHYGIYVFYYANILLGCLAALLLHNRSTYALFSRLGSIGGLRCVGIFVCAAYGATYFADGNGAAVFVAVDLLIFVAFAALLMALLTSSGTFVHRLLDARFVRLAGRVSYATYLIHLLVLNAAERLIPSATTNSLVALLTMTGVVVVATLSAVAVHYFFERPITDYGHRLAKRLFPRDSSALDDALAAKPVS